MKVSTSLVLPCLLALIMMADTLSYAKDPASALANEVIEAAGGKENLFLTYRYSDRLRVGPGKPDLLDSLEGKRTRQSYIEAPNLWWLLRGKEWKERGKEPAKWLAFGWTLAVLADPEAKVTTLPDLVDEETSAEMVGLQVAGPIDPAMDLYFDKQTKLLVRLDWNKEICRFSEWKEFEGFHLPTRCVGYKRKNGEPWYFCEILEVERVAEIPAEVKKPAE